MEKRWARLAVQAQCCGALDYSAKDENGLFVLREELMFEQLERERAFKAVTLMLQYELAKRGTRSASTVEAMLDEGLKALQLITEDTTKASLAANASAEQIERAYHSILERVKRKRKR